MVNLVRPENSFAKQNSPAERNSPFTIHSSMVNSCGSMVNLVRPENSLAKQNSPAERNSLFTFPGAFSGYPLLLLAPPPGHRLLWGNRFYPGYFEMYKNQRAYKPLD